MKPGSYKIRICSECGTAVSLGQLNHWHRGDPRNTPYPVEEIEVVSLSKVRERLEPVIRSELEELGFGCPEADAITDAILAASFPKEDSGESHE